MEAAGHGRVQGAILSAPRRPRVPTAWPAGHPNWTSAAIPGTLQQAGASGARSMGPRGTSGSEVVGVDGSGFHARLRAAQGGDGAAWAQLYREVAPLVVGYLRAQRLPDPEDVAGEVLLEVVRDLERFDGDARSFRSWVLAIAHHRLLDARRRERRRPQLTTDDHASTAAAAGDDVEAETLSALGLDELVPALQALTDDQRSVLLLRVLHDRSIAEVAALLGKRPSAIKQLQRRAAEALRRTLEPADPARFGGATGPPPAVTGSAAPR
jgi:RNA polymerase sigma-70 factor, ECF subfamily